MSGIWPGNSIDVWNKAKINWPYSVHRTLMSGIWPVFLATFQLSLSDVQNMARKTDLIPDNGHVSDIADVGNIARAG